MLIHNTASAVWNMDKLLPLVASAAAGGSHLHAHQPHVMHRDFKPANLFLSDHGVSRLPVPVVNCRPVSFRRCCSHAEPTFVYVRKYMKLADVGRVICRSRWATSACRGS